MRAQSLKPLLENNLEWCDYSYISSQANYLLSNLNRSINLALIVFEAWRDVGNLNALCKIWSREFCPERDTFSFKRG